MSRHHTPAADQPIARMELFAGLSRRQLRQVVGLSTVVRKPAGAVLAREGQLAQQLLVVISGGVVATVDGTTVAELASGAQIGASVVGVPARHRTTVTTTSPTEILVLSVGEVRHLVTQIPVVRARLEGTEARRRMAEPQRSLRSWNPSFDELVGA